MDLREMGRSARYHGQEFRRRLWYYARKRRYGYHDHGSLDRAAERILKKRADHGFAAGSHFRGVWPRDLAFAAPGLSAAGYDDAVADTGDWLVEQLHGTSVFYTDFHDRYKAATPAEGVDTFPALVIILAESGRLREHADAIADLAWLHREKFVDDSLVTGSGSSWWDSAVVPRETYNTALLVAAIERLEERGIETVYTGRSDTIRNELCSQCWNGSYFDEHRGSSVLACDANVVPLYFGLVADDRAASIVESLSVLETSHGHRMRERPFSHAAVRPLFTFHRDYHYHVWPWNCLLYAIGLQRYGLTERARREIERLEGTLDRYGNFLEVLTVAGEPYVKRGYASAEDFTVAAALWVEYNRRASRDRYGGAIDRGGHQYR